MNKCQVLIFLILALEALILSLSYSKGFLKTAVRERLSGKASKNSISY